MLSRILFFSDWKIYGLRTAFANFCLVNGAHFIGAKSFRITYYKPKKAPKKRKAA